MQELKNEKDLCSWTGRDKCHGARQKIRGIERIFVGLPCHCVVRTGYSLKIFPLEENRLRQRPFLNKVNKKSLLEMALVADSSCAR
jgi:hypothetical protein